MGWGEIVRLEGFFSKTFRIVSMIFFVMYLFILAFLTLFGRYHGGIYIHRSINIIPFGTILEYLTSSTNRNIVMTNIWGNIEAFMPMGFLLPVNFKKFRKFKKALFAVMLVTFSIEVLQYIAGIGASDVDDVMLNVLGGGLGYLIYKVLMKMVTFIRDIYNKNRALCDKDIEVS